MMKKLQKTLAVQAATMLLCLLFVSNADAEIRTITATGEYRMGDNDTRTDAKRLALLDAKRLALEQAGTYIESITQVKNFDLTKEEIRAYTAGIVETVEQATKDIMEGSTHIIRVAVTAKIDTDVVARQIDALRRDENAKAELLRLRVENDELRRAIENKTKELLALKSKSGVESVVRDRQKLIASERAKNLVAVAWMALIVEMDAGGSTKEGRAKVRRLVEEVLTIEPSNSEAHYLMGKMLLDEGDKHSSINEFRAAVRFASDNLWVAYNAHLALGVILGDTVDPQGAIEEFKAALRLKPDDARAHILLGDVLEIMGDLDGAISEFRTALNLSGGDYRASTTLGFLLTRKGDLEGAVAVYRALAQRTPESSLSRIYLANALTRKGDLEEAIAEFREAVRLLEVQRVPPPSVYLKNSASRSDEAKTMREFLRQVPHTPTNRDVVELVQAILKEIGG